MRATYQSSNNKPPLHSTIASYSSSRSSPQVRSWCEDVLLVAVLEWSLCPADRLVGGFGG